MSMKRSELGTRKKMPALVTAIIMAIAVLAGVSRAVDVMAIPTPDGRPFITLNIFNQGELFGSEKYGSEGETSAWTLSKAERDGLREGISYWANILGPGSSVTTPAGITVGTYTSENADAISIPYGSNGDTELAWSLLHGRKSDDAAQIRIGWIGGGPDTWNSWATMRVLPDNGGKPHLANVMAHELAHALGVSSSRIVGADTLTAFDKYLVDAAGDPARLGQRVVTVRDGTNFYLPDTGYAFFQGPKVLATLDGAILGGAGNSNSITGIPINGWEGNPGDRFAELSHLELDRSMMSHQNYRNYTGFMEAELALMVDIGYAGIDVKNFYGKSIYKSGETIDNTEGFSARNSAGTAYVPGRYNASYAAIGLHVYGDNNIITQSADILSSGFGSAGIRVDSNGTAGNRLSIAPGVKVHADGALGTGLMAVYGKGHEIIHRGDLRAAGSGGVAARFDFGSNVVSNAIEYRGSFIHTKNGANMALLPELNGALVDSFDVTGSLAGADKAIYISENAFVENINIMNGASLHGDIVSDWNPSNPLIQGGGTHITNLTFGLSADADGKATATPDSAFSLQYAGNILSPDRGLDVSLKGGELVYSGAIMVDDFTAETGSTFTASAFGTPTIIDANAIDFRNGSSIGVREGGFVYGTTDAATATVLRLNSTSINNDATILSNSGAFSAGLHDYTYNSPRLDANGNLVVSLANPRVNESRAATSAIGAPSAMLSRNDAADLLSARLGDNFAAMGNDGETAGGEGSATGASHLC